MNVDKTKYTKLYSSSISKLRILEFRLDEKGITSLIKDNSQSAIFAGFGFNQYDNDLFVFEDDFEKAQFVLKQFLEDNNNNTL